MASQTHQDQGVSVLLAGATGLVGQQALRQLLADPGVREVRALVRRPIDAAGLLGNDAVGERHKLRVCQVDVAHLEADATLFAVDWVLSALGTTIRKAGSQAAFREVDLVLPRRIAQLARQQGARRFLLVSALGAQARSPVFYNRVKGELEDELRAMAFEHLVIAQPSLLAGDRHEFRLGEWLALKLGFLMPARFKPVEAAQVAAGLLQAARRGGRGCEVLSNTQLRRMG